MTSRLHGPAIFEGREGNKCVRVVSGTRGESGSREFEKKQVLQNERVRTSRPVWRKRVIDTEQRPLFADEHDVTAIDASRIPAEPEPPRP